MHFPIFANFCRLLTLSGLTHQCLTHRMETPGEHTPTVKDQHLELQNDLLHGYNSLLYPPADPTTNRGTNVTIYFWPYDIIAVNAERLFVKISGWIDMRWNDPRLVWDPDDFHNINETFVRRDQLWLPSMSLFYSKTEGPPEDKDCMMCPVRLTHDGNVLRGFYVVYSFPCEMNVERFPYDEHTCTMQVANWHTDDRTMDLWPHAHDVDRSIFLPNLEWVLRNMTVHRTRDHYNYGYFPVITYQLTIRRKAGYYIVNQIVPSVLLTSIGIFSYHAPTAATGVHMEKTEMGMTAVLAIYVIQLALAQMMPRVSAGVPLISIFNATMLLLLTLGIVASSGVIMIEKTGIDGRPVNEWIRKLFRLSKPYLPEPHSKAPKKPKKCPKSESTQLLIMNSNNQTEGDESDVVELDATTAGMRSKIVRTLRQLALKQDAWGSTKVGSRLASYESDADDRVYNSKVEMELRQAIEKLTRKLERKKQKAAVEAHKRANRLQWQMAANRAELCSLVIFLVICFGSTLLFLFPAIFGD